MTVDPRTGPSGAARRLLARLRALTPEGRDAFLYGASALFAGVTALAMRIPLYREWGRLAVGPYAAATALMVVVTLVRRSRRRGTTGPGAPDAPDAPDAPGAPGAPVAAVVAGPVPSGGGWRAARIAAFAVVLLGATVVPLALEVVWASHGDASLHVQPEVLVVERAGIRAAHGQDPYQVVDRNGHILIRQSAIPVYELYYPYLPGMVVFGFSSGSKVEARLTDARIQFLLFTVVVTVLALSRVRPGSDARYRSLQALTVLPTAALPLATGGDDMPVVALMLLGLVALQRRRPVLAGLALGAASTLKFTAWPLVFLALFAASDLKGRRAVGRYLVAVLALVVPVVLPVALHNPSAFVDNVVRFPLGLAGVASPAASALPGHILVATFPAIHRAYVVVAAVIGLSVLGRRLLRDPPRDAAAVARLTGWVMLIAILLAPATRVGYLLYPINLFVWSWMFRRSSDPIDERGGPVGGDTDAGQLPSGVSNTSTEYDVVPSGVVGETTTPVSQ
ncbi:MAG TPA: glycosyltransferase family 87 protein [Acidimicrobiales bacterium]|nr:glycosyltransferase family 87 protein [Acidimicrobiales bacterium]